MRTTRNLARRSSALVLAGALAFAGAACGDDEPATDVDVTEEEDAGTDTGTTTEESTEETTEESTDMEDSTDMETTEESTE